MTEPCFHLVCSFSRGGFLAGAAFAEVRQNRGVDGYQPRCSSIFYRLFLGGGVSVEKLRPIKFLYHVLSVFYVEGIW